MGKSQSRLEEARKAVAHAEAALEKEPASKAAEDELVARLSELGRLAQFVGELEGARKAYLRLLDLQNARVSHVQSAAAQQAQLSGNDAGKRKPSATAMLLGAKSRRRSSASSNLSLSDLRNPHALLSPLDEAKLSAAQTMEKLGNVLRLQLVSIVQETAAAEEEEGAQGAQPQRPDPAANQSQTKQQALGMKERTDKMSRAEDLLVRSLEARHQVLQRHLEAGKAASEGAESGGGKGLKRRGSKAVMQQEALRGQLVMELRFLVAQSKSSLAMLQHSYGRYDAAATLHVEALELFGEFPLNSDPENWVFHTDSASWSRVEVLPGPGGKGKRPSRASVAAVAAAGGGGAFSSTTSPKSSLRKHSVLNAASAASGSLMPLASGLGSSGHAAVGSTSSSGGGGAPSLSSSSSSAAQGSAVALPGDMPAPSFIPAGGGEAGEAVGRAVESTGIKPPPDATPVKKPAGRKFWFGSSSSHTGSPSKGSGNTRSPVKATGGGSSSSLRTSGSSSTISNLPQSAGTGGGGTRSHTRTATNTTSSFTAAASDHWRLVLIHPSPGVLAAIELNPNRSHEYVVGRGTVTSKELASMEKRGEVYISLCDPHEKKHAASKVTKRHFQLSQSGSTDNLSWRVADLSSSSGGILLNGVRLKNAALREGDVLCVGGVASAVKVGSFASSLGKSQFVYRCERVVTSIDDALLSGLAPSAVFSGSKFGSGSSRHLGEGMSSADPQAPGTDSVDSAYSYFHVLCVAAQMNLANSQERGAVPETVTKVETTAMFQKVRFYSTRDAAVVRIGYCSPPLVILLSEHTQACELGIPFNLWDSWIKAELVRRRMG